jgi:hypothetical protein
LTRYLGLLPDCVESTSKSELSIHQQKAKKMNWAQDLAIDFLNSVFNSSIDNRQSMGSAVFMEFTLMIVAWRRAQKRILPKTLYFINNAKDNAMVLSAACFRHGTEAEVGRIFAGEFLTSIQVFLRGV